MKKMLFLLALTLVIVSNLFADSADDLMSATRAGDFARVKTLIQQGMDVNTRDPIGITPLHEAAYRGKSEVVEYLIANGADVNTKSFGGFTPLHRASSKGHLEIVKRLIEKGAVISTKDDKGWTPLHWASFGGYFEVVKYLITMGADAQAKTEEIAKGIYADSTVRDFAVERDYPDIVKFLNGTN
jgi:ankyrin repeat protein